MVGHPHNHSHGGDGRVDPRLYAVKAEMERILGRPLHVTQTLRSEADQRRYNNAGFGRRDGAVSSAPHVNGSAMDFRTRDSNISNARWIEIANQAARNVGLRPSEFYATHHVGTGPHLHIEVRGPRRDIAPRGPMVADARRPPYDKDGGRLPPGRTPPYMPPDMPPHMPPHIHGPHTHGPHAHGPHGHGPYRIPPHMRHPGRHRPSYLPPMGHEMPPYMGEQPPFDPRFAEGPHMPPHMHPHHHGPHHHGHGYPPHHGPAMPPPHMYGTPIAGVRSPSSYFTMDGAGAPPHMAGEPIGHPHTGTAMPAMDAMRYPQDALLMQLGSGSIRAGKAIIATVMKEALGIPPSGAPGFTPYQPVLSAGALSLAGQFMGIQNLQRDGQGRISAEGLQAIQGYSQQVRLAQEDFNRTTGANLAVDGVYGPQTGAVDRMKGYPLSGGNPAQRGPAPAAIAQHGPLGPMDAPRPYA